MTENQGRAPGDAVAAARADAAAAVVGVAADDLPALSVLWARWAVIAAGFAAAAGEFAPQIQPSRASFETAEGNGATLVLLPGDRAVLSGGVATEGDAPTGLYSGAPAWVADPVLDARAAQGKLTFCFWHDSGRWHRGPDAPTALDADRAVPGVWSTEVSAGIVASLAAQAPDEDLREAAYDLVAEAEFGTVDRDLLAEVFEDPRFDLDAAWYQLEAAGVVEVAPQELPAEQAIGRVRDHITSRNLDTTGYPLDQLVAERFSVGWMVFVPVPRGQIAIDRAIFYVGDDGLVEHATSAVPPSQYIAGFEARYHQRVP
jgi:hypothetical protein